MKLLHASLLPAALVLVVSPTFAQKTTFTLCGTINYVNDPFSTLPAPWNAVSIGDPFSLSYTFDCATPDSDPSLTYGSYLDAVSSFSFSVGSVSVAQTLTPGSNDLRIYSGQPVGVDQVEGLINISPTSFLFFDLDDLTGTALNGNVPRDGLPCCLDLADFAFKSVSLYDFSGPSMSDFGGTINGCSTCYVPPVDPTCATFDGPAYDGWSGVGVNTSLPSPGPSGLANDFYLRSSDLSGGSYLQSMSYPTDWLALASSGCAAIEYDVQVFNDGMSGTSPNVRPTLVLRGPGGTPMQAAFYPRVDTSEPTGANPGWHHVVAPIAPLAFGELPSGPDGHWAMLPPAVPADWDTLLGNVAVLRFHNDFTSSISEVIGYDNVCLTQNGCVCSGQRPQYAREAWPRSGSVAVATTDSQTGLPGDPNAFVVHVVDLTTLANATPGVNHGAAFYHHASWTKSNLGTVFGTALDGEGNVFVAHSPVYGFTTYDTDALGFGGAGAIYKLEKGVGAAALFATVPNAADPGISTLSESYPGIGDLAYDCKYDKLYASNFEDGKIYIFAMDGTLAGTHDHLAPDPGDPGFAPLGERLWAVGVHGGRLYYSVWIEDQARINPIASNQVWSIALDASGLPVGFAQMEIILPPFAASGAWSNPVAGISFSDEGKMLLAERSMQSDTQSNAHQSWGREYSGPVWTETVNSPVAISGFGSSTTGGVDYEHGSTTGQRRWFVGDYLYYQNPTYVYGLQGAPAINASDPAKSILIDLDQNVAAPDKLQLGDLKISCAEGFPAEPGRRTCAGDGMPHSCPCGNRGTLGHGCANSTGDGAYLCASGLPYSEFAGGVGTDTVRFDVTGMPNNAICLLLTGTMNLQPPPFLGDGVRCCGGPLIRFTPRIAQGGSASFGYPDANEKVSIKGKTPPGNTACYQVWYRDSQGPCQQLSNVSNGYEIQWH